MLFGHRQNTQVCQRACWVRAAPASTFIAGKADASAEAISTQTLSKFRESPQWSFTGTTIKLMLTHAQKETKTLPRSVGVSYNCYVHNHKYRAKKTHPANCELKPLQPPALPSDWQAVGGESTQLLCAAKLKQTESFH